METLIYWKFDPQLTGPITRYLMGNDRPDDLPVIRDYLAHWVAFPFHCFEGNHREELTIALKKAQTREDLETITRDLLNIGIDPF